MVHLQTARPQVKDGKVSLTKSDQGVMVTKVRLLEGAFISFSATQCTAGCVPFFTTPVSKPRCHGPLARLTPWVIAHGCPACCLPHFAKQRVREWT